LSEVFDDYSVRRHLSLLGASSSFNSGIGLSTSDCVHHLKWVNS